MTAVGARSRLEAMGNPSQRVRLTVLVIASIAVLALASQIPGFLSSANMTNLMRQTAILGIVALGQTLVMLVTGIDLSVSAVISVTVMAMAQVTMGNSDRIPLALGFIAAFAVAVGLANGLLVTKRSVPPFAATLGMGFLVEGARLAYTHGYPSSTIPAGIRPLGVANVGPIPVSFIVLLLVAVALGFLLLRTTYGRRVYAVGLSPRVTNLAGVSVDRLIISVYVLSALCAALAGTILAGWIGYVDKTVGQDYAFDSITVAVIGGTSFAGGEGGVLGTLYAALFLQIVLNVVVLLGIDPNVRLIAKALVVVAAVYLIERRRRRALAKLG
jgi:ribose/xylose/arabinose/galactoside ABC-type transport system permease subunit